MATREFLDPDAREAALQYLGEKIPTMTLHDREAWNDVLEHLYPGELRPVIEAWIDWPPHPYAVLDYIATNREPEIPAEPAPRAVVARRRITPSIQEVLDKARAELAAPRGYE